MTSPTTYESDDTALLIVDPYNDFMSKGASTMSVPKKLQMQLASMITCAS